MIPARLLPSFLLALAAGCASSWPVDKFEAPEANLSGRSSFAWQGGEVSTPLAQDTGVLASVETQVRAAVSGELTRKGYVEALDSARADLLVSYQVAGSKRFVLADDKRIGAPSPNEVLTPGGMPLPPASELPREQSVSEGTVVVFVVDPATGKLVWRGLVAVEGRVASKEAAVRQIAEIARHIAQEFPARRAGS
jgi:hypothetical protein